MNNWQIFGLVCGALCVGFALALAAIKRRRLTIQLTRQITGVQIWFTDSMVADKKKVRSSYLAINDGSGQLKTQVSNKTILSWAKHLNLHIKQIEQGGAVTYAVPKES